MVSLSDHMLATGATLTFHYTHPARAVAMQIALAAKLDFTHPSPQNLMRASVFFTDYVAGGGTVDLITPGGGAPPQFRAVGVTEVSGELIADNCELVAVVTQIEQTGAATAISSPGSVAVTKVTFARTAGGPPIYTHVVKTWPGGRPVTEQEARTKALANAQTFSIDVSHATLTVTTTTEQG